MIIALLIFTDGKLTFGLSLKGAAHELEYGLQPVPTSDSSTACLLPPPPQPQ